MPVTENDSEARELAVAGASLVATVKRDVLPSMSAEDFSWLLQEVPGAYVWIGNGPADRNRELHTSGYDFNDQILTVTSRYLAAVAKLALSE